MNLIKYEFKKAIKANYIIASVLAMLLSPLFSLLIMSLDSKGFQLGDFNQINLILLGLIGSKTLFPLLGMLLIKTEYDQDGLIGIFVTPIHRAKLLLAKVVTAIMWSMLLVVFSAVLVVIVELILFKDIDIFYLVQDYTLNYLMVIAYVIPYIVIGMLLSFVMSHVIVPTILFALMIMSGYLMQLFNPIPYFPSAIPEYISEIPQTTHKVFIPFLVLYTIGALAFIILRYVFKYKDYI
ncbi:MAG: ABC transporter permease [Clostridiales bacterium]|nr:ABC transporter permease [Clostridiales bacterium]